MKITSKNKDFGELKFHCDVCETGFSAKRGEYEQVLSPEYKKKKGFNFFSRHIAIPSWHIVVKCPQCGYRVHQYIPTGDPEYETGNPYDW